MHFHIAITSCNREKRLKSLVSRLQSLEESSQHTQETWLYYDGDTINTPPVTRRKDLEGEPHGKKLYWKVMQDVWVEAHQRVGTWDAFLFVQDDVKVPMDDFFDEVAGLMDRLSRKTHRPGALNLYGDGPDPQRTARWTGAPVTHCRVSEVWSAKWIDLQCVVFWPRTVRAIPEIKPISPDRWVVDPGLSSGVGRQLSQAINEKRFGQYMVNEPWVSHEAESTMNTHRNGGVYENAR
jgi:hypothetical protein